MSIKSLCTPLQIVLLVGLFVCLTAVPSQAIYISGPESGDFTYLGSFPTKWDPGENAASFHSFTPPLGPMTPAGATWSVMPAGTPSDAFDPHGGAETPSADVFDLIAGDELAIFDAALDVWAATSGFTNLGMRADSGDPINTPEPGPGNTLFGDIRIGAYGIDGLFGRLAHAYQPGTADTFLTTPTIGGDMHFDSAEIWADDPTDTAADSDFDLFTVSLHEFGHSLGLAHSSIGGSVMWPYYGGALRTLQPDDIAGIQAIYGSAEVIPEPGTIALFSLGLFGMLGYGIRRKKKSS